MYTELLEESDQKKELLNKLKSSEEKLAMLKKNLDKKRDEVFVAKRKMELLQYDLGNLIRNEAISEWPKKVASLYDKHFEKRPPAEEEAEFGEEFSIKEELIRQNNWMNSKLKSIMEKNSKLEKEKKDQYRKV